ncbi:MAG: Ig-like domain-containing protein [Candidatus Latescibacterota bacterium]|nr:Ig-like domain-containing protein [Candidatus Latescibacterota bacterium]
MYCFGRGSMGPLKKITLVSLFCLLQFNGNEARAGLISTIAGTGSDGFSGDGSAATSAKFDPEAECFRVAVNSDGDVYIADVSNNRIRKINVTNGNISTVAGDGSAGFSGDGGNATSASLNRPTNLDFDSSGNMYVLDSGNNRIRKVVLSSGVITTVAGPGNLSDPRGIAVDPSGVVYVTNTYGDGSLQKVVSGQPDNLTTVFSGAGSTHDVAIDNSGNIFVTNSSGGSIRKINPSNYSSTDLATGLYEPRAIDVGPSGYLYVAEIYNHRIIKINASTGLFTTIVGGNGGGYSGDGAQAISARLNKPMGIGVDDWGNLFIADTANSRIRSVTVFQGTNQATSGIEDAAQNLNLVGSHSGGSLSYAIVANPSRGSVSLSGRAATYTPNSNFNGTDSFTWKFSDGIIASAIGTVSITVTAVDNDAPTATSKSVSGDEDKVQTIVISGSDPDGDNLRYIFSAYPSNGSVSLSGNTVTYTPSQNFNGSDSFSFYVSDGNLNSSNATVSITVNAVDDIPEAESQTVTVTSGVPKTIILSGVDIEGNALSYEIVKRSNPSAGDIFLSGNQVIYTPNENFVGSESFTFVVSDGTLTSKEGVVSILTDPDNSYVPQAISQVVKVNEDTDQSIVLFGSDLDGNVLTYALSNNPLHGVVVLKGNTITYRPALNFSGMDSLFFTVSDGGFVSSPAKVLIEVNAINDAPIGNRQWFLVEEDQSRTILLTGHDPEGDELSYQLLSNPFNGTATLNGNTVTYTPFPDYTGPDNFLYAVSDDSLMSVAETISISVNGSNDPPKVASQFVVGFQDVPQLFVLDSRDVDGDQLTYNLISGPVNGDVSFRDTTALYVPYAGFVGLDAFKYTASDGFETSSFALVQIDIRGENNAPILVPIEDRSVYEGDSISFSLLATDVDGDSLSYFFAENPTGSILVGNRFSWTPTSDQKGTHYLDYVVSDGNGGSARGTLCIVVNPETLEDLLDRPEGVITLDWNQTENDQGQRVKYGVEAGDIFELQIFGNGLPEVKGWSAEIIYDPEQASVVENSFEVGSFLPGIVSLSRNDVGKIILGGALLDRSYSSSGDGFLGTIGIEVIEGYTGSTDIYVSETNLRLSEGESLKSFVYHKVELSSETDVERFGDFNSSGTIDFEDFFLFADAFGSRDRKYDLDRSGAVDFSDFFIFADNFGRKEEMAKLIALAEQLIGLPVSTTLYPNYPNPFNTETVIPYRVDSPSKVIINIFDINGQKIRELTNDFHGSGNFKTYWDGRNDRHELVSSGIYLCSMDVAGKVLTRKMMLMK